MKVLAGVLAGVVWAGMMASTRADTVTLASGAVIRGEVVAEDAHEVRVIVSRTADGDIQTLKIISQNQVSGIERGNPDVAIEDAPAPPTAIAETVAQRATDEAQSLQAGLHGADAQTADGHYEEAERGYRAIVDAADQRVAALPPDTVSAQARQDLLQLKRDAYTHLLVALQGNLERRQTALKSAEGVAQERARASKQRQQELDEVREVDDKRGGGTRRLGQGSAAAGELTRERDLTLALAQDEEKRQAHATWVQLERKALVDLETEIALAREALKGADVDLKEAQRNSRTRH